MTTTNGNGGPGQGDGGPASRAAGDGSLWVLARRLAHGRTGDKGNRCSISVIAWRPEFYPILVEQLTEEAVLACFAFRQPSRIARYLLPRIGAMNFVIDDVLDGGVNDALNLDTHGKALSFLLLSIQIRIPVSAAALLVGDEPGIFD